MLSETLNGSEPHCPTLRLNAVSVSVDVGQHVKMRVHSKY